MMPKFLLDYAVQTGEHEFQAAPFVLNALACEFDLDYHPGETIQFTTLTGEEYSVLAATMH